MPSIQDQSHIGEAFQLELVGDQRVLVTGCGSPVYVPQRVAHVVLPHPEEVHAGPTSACRKRAGETVGSLWSDIDASEPYNRRVDQ